MHPCVMICYFVYGLDGNIDSKVGNMNAYLLDVSLDDKSVRQTIFWDKKDQN
jgi:hypothetical protein